MYLSILIQFNLIDYENSYNFILLQTLPKDVKFT